MSPPETVPAPLLLYDGTCGFCAASVQLVLRHDRRGLLRFAPLDGPTAAAVRAAHPLPAGADSMVWVEHRPGGGIRVFGRSDAALRVARYLGGAWHLARLGRLLPRPMRDAVYDLVARHRHRLPGAVRCLVPAAEVRDRFLD